MDTKKTETSAKSRNDDCNHPSLTKEFVSGVPTGNFVCAQCGRHLSAILKASRK
ncbi:hypothetical protein ACH50O_07855 [Methylomonas sp. 2BW1-5-20]|uniref:hypothetical protein n=1 Tax=Methylomonas sp. 2BW1-5-20 TaxID=3376686 RepID=UPI0040533484